MMARSIAKQTLRRRYHPYQKEPVFMILQSCEDLDCIDIISVQEVVARVRKY
jgi:hypothetical protein